MTGERWQIVEQESVLRPRPVFWSRGSTFFREERRPLMLPSDIRQLPSDEEIIFVAGAKPVRAKKLRFDDEPVFRDRPRQASWVAGRLTTTHDWLGVRPLGRLVKDKKGSVKVAPALAQPTTTNQGDLFPDLKISEQALAGLRGQPRGSGI
jgi:type IV secretory pathway TraG/TraD family ATPase VirD4